ncbi:MAG: hypothetical protein WA865_10235 [Spirulinaceae cyanobacterium]
MTPEPSVNALSSSSQLVKTPNRNPFNLSLPTSWQFWSIIAIIFSGGIGFIATALLLKLPAVPNCPAIFWPMASASVRIYCAQLAVNKQTVDDYLEAIELVADLPDDHPMRKEIDSNIEEWALEILKIGEKKFQAGQFKGAIAVANKIPEKVRAYEIVQERIERWRSIWAKGEKIYAQARKDLANSNWSKALREGVKLTYLDNKYWSSTQYEKLVREIQLAQEESSKLDKAYAALRRGGYENYIQAISMAQEISSGSTAYKEAQRLIEEAGNKLVTSAQERLDKRDWQGLLRIANAIPSSLKLQEQVKDWTSLANAGISASAGSVAGLERGIAQAQQVGAGRPLYSKAQSLITRWQREIEDVAHLERARQLARSGGIGELSAAIAEARLIPQYNPRYQEARGAIQEWSNQIKNAEDKPFLERANQLASFGDIGSLERAIDEVNSIAPGRPFYSEAQRKASEWRNKIQVLQDQPYLNQAETLYQSGNFPQAIEAARQIGSNRASSPDAQKIINASQKEIQQAQRESKARESLEQAVGIAEGRTPDAYVRAISLARQVPSGTKLSSQSVQYVDNWSYQILRIAQDRASNNSLNEAISIAKKVPSGTEAYQEARGNIQRWQEILQPPAPVIETVPGN